MDSINLRYFALESTEMHDLLLADVFEPVKAEAAKWAALERLNIKRLEDKPGRCWVRAMCEENNLKYSMPAPRELVDVLTQNIAAYRFYWWLV